MTFEDIEGEIKHLKEELDTCERKLSKVFKESEEHLQQPFSDLMNSFVEQSRAEIAEQDQVLTECKKRWGVKYKQNLACYLAQNNNVKLATC